MRQLNNPLISVVLTGRNDNYGGDFKARLGYCINCLCSQLSNLDFCSEIIFVNYNPLPQPPINKFINWQKSTAKIKIRIITVPADVHETFVTTKKLKNVPLLEYVGKNVGIRRAQGIYILCINPDIVFPDNFFSDLIQLLNNDSYIRTDRIDFKKFEYGKPSGIERIHLKGHSFDLTQNSFFSIVLIRLKAMIMNAWRKQTINLESIFDLLRLKVYYDNIGYYYHLNASGDFMLMHRNYWFGLKGYYEQAGISLHKDSLMVVQAANLGLKEVCFKLPVYHCEHERRYDAQTNMPEFINEYQFLQKEAEKMKATKQAIIYNDDNWGAAKFTLDEIVL